MICIWNMREIQNMKSVNRLTECLSKNGYGVELLILRFGSLGSVQNDAWKCLKGFTNDKTYVKDVLKWCSLSSIIGSNYIWRHRVKKLLV